MHRDLEASPSLLEADCRYMDKCHEISTRLRLRLQSDYISHFNPDNPLVQWYMGVARIVPKVGFLVHHPVFRDRIRDLPLTILDGFFLAAVEGVEFARFIESCTLTAKWTWHFRQSSARWYLLTFLLTELCVRPSCPSVDRAWHAVSSAYREWGIDAAGQDWETVSILMGQAAKIRDGGAELEGYCPG